MIRGETRRRKTVVLHVGHPKTGSSVIQSFLALNDLALKALGISYPEHQSFARARRLGITSGNVSNVETFDEYIIDRASEQDEDIVLFSSETLFQLIPRHPARLRNIASHHDLVIILLVRNPLETCVSSYSQAIKRGGHHAGFLHFLDEYDLPKRLDEFLGLARETSCRIETMNFSRHRADIVAAFLGILGLKTDGFVIPARQVNRSLSVEEACIAQAFNRRFGETTLHFISDPFCEDLADYRGTAPGIPHDVRARFIARNERYIDRVNALLPEGEKYLQEWRDQVVGEAADDDGDILITSAHFDVMAAAMKAYFDRLENERTALRRRVEGLQRQVADQQAGRNRRSDEEQAKADKRKRRELKRKVSRLRARVARLKSRPRSRSKWWG